MALGSRIGYIINVFSKENYLNITTLYKDIRIVTNNLIIYYLNISIYII